jgi:CheY-specific phosphatase CheX
VTGPSSADLARLSATVLADCAFLLLKPVEPGGPFDDAVHAVVGFSGATRGRLVLSASRELAERIAADMLGMESGDPEASAHAEEALGELSNVLLGILVARFCDCDAAWNLGPPRVHVGSLPGTTDGHAHAVTLSSDEGERLHIQWVTEVEER